MATELQRRRELAARMHSPEGIEEIFRLYREKVLPLGKPLPTGHLVEEMINEILKVEFFPKQVE